MRAHDILAFVWPLTVAAVLGACHAPNSVPPGVKGSEAPSTVGTVRRLDIEGGCWVIDTPAGRVQPTELPADYRIDGLRVEVTLGDAPDTLSACQAGELKVIRTIRRR